MADGTSIDVALVACIVLFSSYAAWTSRAALPRPRWCAGPRALLAGALAIGLALAGLVTASLTLAALAIPAAVLAATLIVFGPDGVTRPPSYFPPRFAG